MLKNLKNKKKKKGFTVIELIIVIAIIAILAFLAIPKFGEVRKDAALKSDIANAKTIANTATTLISEGKLAVGSHDIDNSKTSGNLIEEALQNPPKPETTGYNKYVATINATGDVTVTMSNGSKIIDLFPVPATKVE